MKHSTAACPLWFRPSFIEEATLPGNLVIGWSVDRTTRSDLLERLTPRYPDVVADHVTLESRVAPDAPLPGPVTCRIVGRADDGEGVEAMVVEIDGSTHRPDGSTYHITWSLDRKRGRTAVESNAVIRDKGWTPIGPYEVAVRPTRFIS